MLHWQLKLLMKYVVMALYVQEQERQLKIARNALKAITAYTSNDSPEPHEDLDVHKNWRKFTDHEREIGGVNFNYGYDLARYHRAEIARRALKRMNK